MFFAHLPVAAQKEGLCVRVQQSFHSFLSVRRLQELVQLHRVALVRLFIKVAPTVVEWRHKGEHPK